MSTAQIFRKHNFILLDKILHNGDNAIEARSFIDPNDSIFNNPIKNKNGINRKPIKRKHREDCSKSC